MENTGKQFRKRNAILTCLRQSVEHPSAEDLFAQLQQEHSDISLASVYRNLTLFKDQGLIVSLGSVGGIERFDGCVEPHVHFACRCCGSVVDVPEARIPPEISAGTAQTLGCTVEHTRLMMTGVCKNCQYFFRRNIL